LPFTIGKSLVKGTQKREKGRALSVPINFTIGHAKRRRPSENKGGKPRCCFARRGKKKVEKGVGSQNREGKKEKAAREILECGLRE